MRFLWHLLSHHELNRPDNKVGYFFKGLLVKETMEGSEMSEEAKELTSGGGGDLIRVRFKGEDRGRVLEEVDLVAESSHGPPGLHVFFQNVVVGDGTERIAELDYRYISAPIIYLLSERDWPKEIVLRAQTLVRTHMSSRSRKRFTQQFCSSLSAQDEELFVRLDEIRTREHFAARYPSDHEELGRCWRYMDYYLSILLSEHKG